MSPQAVISTRILSRRPLLEALPALHEAGFEALEVCAAPGHFDFADPDAAARTAERCRELGLSVVSLHAPYSAPLDITVVQRGERSMAVNEVLAAAQALSILGGRYLVIHPGSTLRVEPHLKARMDALSESLLRIHGECGRLGLELLVEEMEPDAFGGRDEDLARLAGLSPRPFDGFCMDFVHSFLAGTLQKRIETFARLIRLVHLGDTRGVGAGHEHLLPGKGAIPWKGALAVLRRAGIHAPWVLEADARDAPESELYEEARRSLEMLRGIDATVDARD